MKLTQARLKELLHYDPETGVFVWRERILSQNRPSLMGGKIAGGINSKGYRVMSVDGKLYRASRLTFLYMEGYFPEHEVDHRNRIRHDDRWCNLRHVSSQCNSRNCSLLKRNTSGITGVRWTKRRQRWLARIVIFRKAIHLGYFSSKLDAAHARWNAEVKHDFPNCNTTSTAYLYLRDRGLA